MSNDVQAQYGQESMKGPVGRASVDIASVSFGGSIDVTVSGEAQRGQL